MQTVRLRYASDASYTPTVVAVSTNQLHLKISRCDTNWNTTFEGATVQVNGQDQNDYD